MKDQILPELLGIGIKRMQEAFLFKKESALVGKGCEGLSKFPRDCSCFKIIMTIAQSVFVSLFVGPHLKYTL